MHSTGNQAAIPGLTRMLAGLAFPTETLVFHTKTLHIAEIQNQKKL